MNFIEMEVMEVQKLCERLLPNTTLIACTAIQPSPLVRVDINQNENTKSTTTTTNQQHRQVTACLRFPLDYPAQTLLVELKSKHLDGKFLDALAALCESHAKSHAGKRQVLEVVRFVQQYVQDNPLCVCYGEIQKLRNDLGGAEVAMEQLKLKQRTSTLHLTAIGGAYYYRVKAIVPPDYPLSCVELKDQETNLPAVLLRYLNGQSREIARQCVEPPLRKSSNIAANSFQPKPSVYVALKFCLDATRDFHTELCPICDEPVLPTDPGDLVLDDSKDRFVERVYCGHLFHQGCLKHYLQEPPFPKTGKLCPARRKHARSDTSYSTNIGNVSMAQGAAAAAGDKCCIRLAHDRWIVDVKVAETRWAQKQARERELQEVVDFLQ